MQFSGMTIFFARGRAGRKGQAADQEASSCNATQLPRFLVFPIYCEVCSAEQKPGDLGGEPPTGSSSTVAQPFSGSQDAVCRVELS